jgi:uncharacterized membrane protein
MISLIIGAANGESFSSVTGSVSESSQADVTAGSSLVAKVIILVALWIVIRIVVSAVREIFAALVKLLSVLFATAVLFAIVSLSLVAHLTGGEATSHAHPPSNPVAAGPLAAGHVSVIPT